MNILFYDLDMNKVHELPASSKSIGYRAMDTKIEFNGDGSFLLSFWDEDLENKIRANKEGFIIKFGNFEGFSTDYQFTDNTKRLYGMHLNGLLHKEVIPACDVSGDLETLVYDIINNKYPWLTVAEKKGGFETVSYKTDTYKQGNSFISNLVARGHAGYKIYINEDSLTFELLKSESNTLMLSEGNLTAHNFQENFDSKNQAYGGWYKQEQPEDSEGNKPDPIWTYIATDPTKTGIRKQDVVLSATTATEALNELKQKAAEFQITAETRNIEFEKDYKLGDRLRMQKNGQTEIKTVIGIEIWHKKNEYTEQPILGELKEVESDGCYIS